MNNDALSPGEKMPDGTIYAGVSPETGKAMYTTLADAPLKMKWETAKDYTAKLHSHGYSDWRVPTQAELNVLIQSLSAVADFNRSGSVAADEYWTSVEGGNPALWDKRFSKTYEDQRDKPGMMALHCVRG